MNRTEHLLTIFAEECLESAHRATKALRFGLEEVETGQLLTNRERMYQEFMEAITVLEMIPPEEFFTLDVYAMRAKRAKVEKYLAYSKELGTCT